MRRCCAVFSCVNRNVKGTKISMYRFPTDPALCEKWVEFCKSDQINEMLVLQGIDELRNSFYCVCSDHFEKPCFVNPKSPAQGIYKGSIPTIIAGHPMLVSNFKKDNQIPEYAALGPKPQEESEQGEDNMPIEMLYEDLEETTAPTTEAERPPIEEPSPAPKVSKPFDRSILDCHCKEKSEYEPKFIAERTRAVGLVQQLNATRRKLAEVRKPHKAKQRTLRRVNMQIEHIKEKIRKLAEEHCVLVELDSSADEEDFMFPGIL